MAVLRLLKELENGSTLRLQTSRNLDVNRDIWTFYCQWFSDPNSSVSNANSGYFQRRDQGMTQVLNTASLWGTRDYPIVRGFLL